MHIFLCLQLCGIHFLVYLVYIFGIFFSEYSTIYILTEVESVLYRRIITVATCKSNLESKGLVIYAPCIKSHRIYDGGESAKINKCK